MARYRFGGVTFFWSGYVVVFILAVIYFGHFKMLEGGMNRDDHIRVLNVLAVAAICGPGFLLFFPDRIVDHARFVLLTWWSVPPAVVTVAWRYVIDDMRLGLEMLGLRLLISAIISFLTPMVFLAAKMRVAKGRRVMSD